MKNKHINDKKSSGFKVPNNYFETFDDTLLQNLDKEASFLTAKTAGFQIPKDYFNTVDTKVIKAISKEKKPKVITLSNVKTLVYAASIAAAILLFFNIYIFNTNVSIEDIELAAVESFIIEDDISSYEIASLLTEHELNANNIVEYSLQDEHIEEYLLNNADVEALIIEY